MSGHSKWSTIKRKKEKTDGARAQVFTKIGREIAVAVKEGGADPANNSKLYDLVAKAKANNVPNDNIDRAIKKASADGDKNDYVDMVYEGYGPCGVAVIVEALTDNKNRTAGDLRHYFDKFGGNLGQTGCVSFMFTRKGIVIVENIGVSEEKLMDDCMEVGASDFNIEDDIAEISCEPNDVHTVNKGLIEKGYKVLSAEAVMVPNMLTAIADEEMAKKMELLLEHLEDNDDVQDVFHNWDIPDEPDEE
ncbi:MAG: YebC/PmpR family DNA-binding transcriptional regulator [Hydrogenoanaerobacterium sp.]